LAALRLALTSALLLTAASWLGRQLDVSSWMLWIAGVAVTLALAVGLALLIGPSGRLRHDLWGRIRAIASGIRRKP
jgi:hypothetical protein